MDTLLQGSANEPLGIAGRGTVYRFTYDRSSGILRRHRRGGLVRHIMTDAYFFRNRSLQELRVHVYAFENGLPVPEPLGVAWTRVGPAFKGSIATRELQGRTLYEYLSSAPRYPEDTLRRVGGLVREMHDLGIYHADLQVRNVFLGHDRLYLLDFDNARVCRRLSGIQRARNLLRFRRSIQRNYLPSRFYAMVLEGYGALRPQLWLRGLYSFKGMVADVFTKRHSFRD